MKAIVVSVGWTESRAIVEGGTTIGTGLIGKGIGPVIVSGLVEDAVDSGPCVEGSVLVGTAAKEHAATPAPRAMIAQGTALAPSDRGSPLRARVTGSQRGFTRILYFAS